MTKLKNSIGNHNSRLSQVEERIGKLEDRSSEITWSEKQNEKRMKMNEESLWHTIKLTNTHIMGIPKRQSKKNR